MTVQDVKRERATALFGSSIFLAVGLFASLAPAGELRAQTGEEAGESDSKTDSKSANGEDADPTDAQSGSIDAELEAEGGRPAAEREETDDSIGLTLDDRIRAVSRKVFVKKNSFCN